MIFSEKDFEFYEKNDYSGAKLKSLYERLKCEKESEENLTVELGVNIDYYVFSGCPVKIDTLVLPKKATLEKPYRWGSLLKTDDTIELVDKIGTLEIPKGVKKIKDGAFFDFDYRDRYKKVWDLEKLILPSTGFTEISDLSFAGLLPKEIYLKNPKGELITSNKKFRIIQGRDANRADGSAVLIDLTTMKQLIPSNSPAFEFKVIEQEFPNVALEWRKMNYLDFLSLLNFCHQFAIHRHEKNSKYYRYVNYEGHGRWLPLKYNPQKFTLLDLRENLFLLKPGQSPNPKLMRCFPALTTENFALLSRYPVQVSQVIDALVLDKDFFENHLFRKHILDKNDNEQNKTVARLPQNQNTPQKERIYFKLDEFAEVQSRFFDRMKNQKKFQVQHCISRIEEFCFTQHLDAKVRAGKLYKTFEEYKSREPLDNVSAEIQIPNFGVLKKSIRVKDFEAGFEELKKTIENGGV